MSFEMSKIKPFSPEEKAKRQQIEQERIKTTAELINKGAEPTLDDKGKIINLEVPQERMDIEKEKVESPETWADKERIVNAVESSNDASVYDYPVVFRADNPEFWKDEIIAEVAVEISGLNLKYFSPEIQDNKEVVLKAVKKDGVALEFVSKRLQDDEEVAIAAVKQNYEAFRFCSERLRGEYRNELRDVYREEKRAKHGSLDRND